jgi:hypothetical protein
MTERYPVRTKAITAAILNFLGDLFCQLVIEKNGKLDVKRTAVITFLGLVLVGPTLHIWYLTLSKVVTAVGVKGTVIRLLLDQLVFSPAFIAVFFSSLLTLENRTSDIIPKLQQVIFLSFAMSQFFQNVLHISTSGKMHATRRMCVVLEAAS